MEQPQWICHQIIFQMQEYGIAVIDDRTGIDLNSFLLMRVKGSSTDMIIEIIFHCRNNMANVVKNFHLYQNEEFFVLNIPEEMEKHNLTGLIDIMILNMDGSVEGELEVQLLKEDL
ncbi:MAG: hypothetical protein ACOZCO_00900 [Bacteroidota bacterium]